MASAKPAPIGCPSSDPDRHLQQLGDRAERTYARILAQGDERLARIWRHALERFFECHDPHPLAALLQFERIPAAIEEFVESPEYLGNPIMAIRMLVCWISLACGGNGLVGMLQSPSLVAECLVGLCQSGLAHNDRIMLVGVEFACHW